MALTKTVEVDQLEIVGPYKAIGVQEKIIVKDDGTLVSESIHRRMLNCGDLDASDNLVDTDISSESSDIQNLCNTYWTTDIKNSWKEYQISIKPPTDSKGFGD